MASLPARLQRPSRRSRIFNKAKLDVAGGAGSGTEVCFRIDPTIYDGRFANNGWLQELPKPVSKLCWDNAAIMSPKTAKKLKSFRMARMDCRRARPHGSPIRLARVSRATRSRPRHGRNQGMLTIPSPFISATAANEPAESAITPALTPINSHVRRALDRVRHRNQEARRRYRSGLHASALSDGRPQADPACDPVRHGRQKGFRHGDGVCCRSGRIRPHQSQCARAARTRIMTTIMTREQRATSTNTTSGLRR